MFDLNTILSAALQQAVEAATKPLLERIAALEARPAGNGLTRDEVREIANQAAEDAISDHCSDHDHDEFISDISDALSNVDLLDYMGDFEGKVRDAVSSLSFEISVN